MRESQAMERAAASLAEFLDSPEGTYVHGENFLCGCAGPTLYAYFLWGRPSREEMSRAVRAFAVHVRPAAQPHRSYFDCTGLTGIDREAFAVQTAFWKDIAPLEEGLVQRQAVIRPPGFTGVFVAGFFKVFKPRYPARTFANGASAMPYLGEDPSVLERWQRELDRVRGTPELAALRALLDQRPDLGIDAAAKKLGTSTRTLQRRLELSSTNFQRERDRGRLTAAKTMLDESDSKLASVAAELGFASPQHFSRWFRDRTTQSPTEFRARRNKDALHDA